MKKLLVPPITTGSLSNTMPQGGHPFSHMKSGDSEKKDTYGDLIKAGAPIERVDILKRLNNYQKDVYKSRAKVLALVGELEDLLLEIKKAHPKHVLQRDKGNYLVGNRGIAALYKATKIVNKQYKLTYMANVVLTAASYKDSEESPIDLREKIDDIHDTDMMITQEDFLMNKKSLENLQSEIETYKTIILEKLQQDLISCRLNADTWENEIPKIIKSYKLASRISTYYYDLTGDTEFTVDSYINHQRNIEASLLNLVDKSKLEKKSLAMIFDTRDIDSKNEYILQLQNNYPQADSSLKHKLNSKSFIKEVYQIFIVNFLKNIIDYSGNNIIEELTIIQDTYSLLKPNGEPLDIYKFICFNYTLSDRSTISQSFLNFTKASLETLYMKSDEDKQTRNNLVKEKKARILLEGDEMQIEDQPTPNEVAIEPTENQLWFIEELLDYYDTDNSNKIASEKNKIATREYILKTIGKGKMLDMQKVFNLLRVEYGVRDVAQRSELASENDINVYKKGTYKVSTPNSVATLEGVITQDIKSVPNYSELNQRLDYFNSSPNTLDAEQFITILGLMGENCGDLQSQRKITSTFKTHMETPEGIERKKFIRYIGNYLSGHRIRSFKRGGYQALKLSGNIRLVKEDGKIRRIMDHREYENFCTY